MEIIKLEESNNLFFDKICDWYYNWLGIKNNESIEEIKCTFEHSLCKNKLPQTFVALIDGEQAGMYQLSMSDDLNSRPDLYPWFINVYVDEKFRGRNVARELMNTVKEKKFGWKFIEEVKTFKDDSPVERFYKLEI